MFIRSVMHLLDVMCTNRTMPQCLNSFIEEKRDSLAQLKQELEVLLGHLRSLHVVWDNRYDAIHTPSSSRFVLSRTQSRERERTSKIHYFSGTLGILNITCVFVHSNCINAWCFQNDYLPTIPRVQHYHQWPYSR